MKIPTLAFVIQKSAFVITQKYTHVIIKRICFLNFLINQKFLTETVVKFQLSKFPMTNFLVEIFYQSQAWF